MFSKRQFLPIFFWIILKSIIVIPKKVFNLQFFVLFGSPDICDVGGRKSLVTVVNIFEKVLLARFLLNLWWLIGEVCDVALVCRLILIMGQKSVLIAFMLFFIQNQKRKHFATISVISLNRHIVIEINSFRKKVYAWRGVSLLCNTLYRKISIAITRNFDIAIAEVDLFCQQAFDGDNCVN